MTGVEEAGTGRVNFAVTISFAKEETAHKKGTRTFLTCGAMIQKCVAIAVLLAVVSFLSGCNPSGNDVRANVRMTVASGVAVPGQDELKRKIELALRQPSGTRVFTSEGGRWVEMKKPPVFSKDMIAVVRSFDAKERVARVELTYPDYKMPMLQLWRYDGKAWSDSIDPGIFVR